MPILKTVDYICYAVRMTSNSVEFKKVCFVVIAFNPTTQSFNHAPGRYQVTIEPYYMQESNPDGLAPLSVLLEESYQDIIGRRYSF
jgi:hypothetical protein